MAFDPLLTEKNLPKKEYDFYLDERGYIERSCDLPDFKNTISLFQAINLGLCRNVDSKISWLTIKKQAAIYGVSKSTYLPTISLVASKDNVSSSSKNQITKNSQASTSQNISFNWLLYDFGTRSANVNRDYFALVQSAYTHNYNLQNIIYKIIYSYSNLFAANESLKAALLSEKSNQIAYDVALKKFAVGVSPKADVLKIEASYSQAILNRQKAENSLANYLGSFLQILNLPQGTKIDLSPPSFSDNATLLEKGFDKLINEAMLNRPDLKALIAKEKSLDQDRKSASLDRLPKISLYGSKDYSQIRNGENQIDNSIGVKATFNFFTGFSESYTAKGRDYNYQSVKEERKNTENQIALDVWNGYQNFKTAQDTEITATKLLKSADESKKVTLGSYKVGSGSAVDVVSAEASYANALQELILAKYSKFTSKAALLLAIGELNLNNLNQESNADEIK